MRPTADRPAVVRCAPPHRRRAPRRAFPRRSGMRRDGFRRSRATAAKIRCRRRACRPVRSGDETRNRRGARENPAPGREWNGAPCACHRCAAAGEQSGGVGMARVAEHRLDVPLLHDPAAVHHGNAVGGFGDQAEVVGDQDHGGAGAPARRGEHLHHLRLDGDVERSGRLVGDQQRRVVGDRHGDHRPLPHPARQLVGKLAARGAVHPVCRRCPGASRRDRGSPRATVRADAARSPRRSACRCAAPG